MRPPISTYRLQLHADFTFDDARAVTDYLDALGVTDVYASPFLKASSGSLHGYDICDHGSLNPEIGDDDAFVAWSDGLVEKGMGSSSISSRTTWAWTRARTPGGAASSCTARARHMPATSISTGIH